MRLRSLPAWALCFAMILLNGSSFAADSESVKAEHDTIGEGKETAGAHTTNPDAQWYPDAGLGLFIHWGIASVKAINISWPMIPGRPLAQKRIDDPAERERIIRDEDWNLNGKPNSITPNEYWAMAKDFNPQQYDPDKWLKAAHDAGFQYAVLTTRHHEGFALWPSAYGDFNTKNYMGGRDLVKDYVEACRRNGLKVGLYYSPPDWHFDRDYMSFLYGGARKLNPEFPALDADLKPRATTHTPEEIKEHQDAFAKEVNGQIEELLTRYGKIDLIWFDGKPNISWFSGKDDAPPGEPALISIERIRELQPGIVINPRLHGHGDFITYERKLGTNKIATGWAELCQTWTSAWPYTPEPFRANGFVLGEFVKCRSLGINYLLGVGPMSDGEMSEDVYKNMTVVGQWMKTNGESVHGTKPLPAEEKASVFAVANGSTRYLFAVPKFKNGGMYDRDLLPAEDETITLKGISQNPASAKLLGDGGDLKFDYSDNTLSVVVPANKRTTLVDVVRVDLASGK